ncbi:MAG: DUF4157 domain-containing protein [Defluviitaleaceae bacterium]|nr:DUF4157 domain-containing protein [Defluviitaleaceae bacterium]
MYAIAEPVKKDKPKPVLIQRKESDAPNKQTLNRTGIPDSMKARFENNSGFSFDDVQVYYNSPKPAQLQALAYTQGNQVHIAPGQEEHLPHELGHVVQQKAGIVRPTTRVNGVEINDDERLERDADKSLSFGINDSSYTSDSITSPVVQRIRWGSFLATMLSTTGAGAAIGGPVGAGIGLLGGLAVTGVSDLYTRYKRYVQPLDTANDVLRGGGVAAGVVNGAAPDIDAQLDQFRLLHAQRGAFQDDARDNLSPIGYGISSLMRRGHPDPDELIMNNIRRVVGPGQGGATDDDMEIAIQQASLGATRTNEGLSSLARRVGRPIDSIMDLLS